jgi:hypothetical protein
MKQSLKWAAPIALIVALGGCSTIKLKPGAEEVEILAAERVADCKKLGKTTVSVAKKLGVIPRGDKAIREDLHRLARNSAVAMNGDTISAESSIEEGEQTFGVYDCI